MAGGRGSKDYRKSKAKERQVVCRYCRQQTAEQNYKRHLQLLHKEEYKKNPGDLRQYGEQTLGGFLKQPSVRGVEGGETSRRNDRLRSPRRDEGGDRETSGEESSRFELYFVCKNIWSVICPNPSNI